MNVDQMLTGVRDAMRAQVVYGEPIERNGTVVVPAAKVRGGGGGGGDAEHNGGGGFGLTAKPAGAWIIRGEKVSEACMSFADMVKAHRIMHPGDPMLTAHTERAEKLMSSDGTWVYARGGPGHITGVYASAGAVYGVTSLPEKKPLPKPMAV
jgi:hypothetical protein